MSNLSAGKEMDVMRARTHELTSIQKANEEKIQELLHEKQQLFNIVSHDVKGPLNRIFALIQLFQFSSENLQPDQKEYLGKIHIMIADGLGMIRNLTDSQKLEAKAVIVQNETLHLSQAFNTLIRNYRVLAEKKRIQLHLTINPAQSAYGDRYIITRVMDNLLSNAIKFTPEGRNVFVTVQEQENRVSIQVRDEGPGISDEDQSNLYKKFYTLAATPTGGETTTGLGLSVAKGFAEIAGMELTCTSKLGEGTIFTLGTIKTAPI
jgi:signal transduction histidine kinase